jgi:hypothetical protein
MTGIIISTGCIVWTAALQNNQDNQLGSLALLASLSLGVAAMFTSAVQLNILNSSFRQILLLKEVKINGHAIVTWEAGP